MLRRSLLFLMVLCLLPFSFSAVAAEEATAADLTSRCSFYAGSNRKTFSRCRDRNYRTWWQSQSGSGAWIEVTMPGGESASGVWIQWYEHPHAWALQLPGEGKTWKTERFTDGVYLSEYLELPDGTERFRIANAPGVSRRMMIAELHVYGPGATAPEVQRWTPPAEKAELMLVVAHPDDEVLWFGGMLPTYAGERKKICQVCMMVPTMPYRRLELLDCLWTCGVAVYPVWAAYPDSFSATLQGQYKHWKKNGVYQRITGWIRQFKPDVLLTHDFGGEYGHGAHRVCADAVAHCLALAANPDKYPASYKEFGTWNVPKCYIHLYGENVIDMDWRQPLSAFGGKTSFEVAEEGFLCHLSQQHTDYHVEDFGPWDNSLFGLYRSLVGPDEAKNDFFEHLPGAKTDLPASSADGGGTLSESSSEAADTDEALEITEEIELD